MKEEEMLEEATEWVKENGQYSNETTGNTVEVYPEIDQQDDIVSVRAVLYTPNNLQEVAKADTMEELYSEMLDFFHDYNKAVGIE